MGPGGRQPTPSQLVSQQAPPVLRTGRWRSFPQSWWCNLSRRTWSCTGPHPGSWALDIGDFSNLYPPTSSPTSCSHHAKPWWMILAQPVFSLLHQTSFLLSFPFPMPSLSLCLPSLLCLPFFKVCPSYAFLFLLFMPFLSFFLLLPYHSHVQP